MPRTNWKSVIHFISSMVSALPYAENDSVHDHGVPLWCATEEAYFGKWWLSATGREPSLVSQCTGRIAFLPGWSCFQMVSTPGMSYLRRTRITWPNPYLREPMVRSSPPRWLIDHSPFRADHCRICPKNASANRLDHQSK